MFKRVKRKLSMLSKKKEDMRKAQMKLLKPRNYNSEIKTTITTLDWINCIFRHFRRKDNELENTETEIVQNSEERN